jgi:hypothetical protein
MLRFHTALALSACLLLGCDANRPDAAPTAVAQPRYPGEASLALLYVKAGDGKMYYLCSATLVALDDRRVPQPGVLTAAHCFQKIVPDGKGYYVSFDEGKTHTKLGRAWLGDRLAGSDIAFIELAPPKTQGTATPPLPSPLPVTLSPPSLIAGDEVWTWGNPDDQGRALSVGYVMNPRYRKPPIGGTVDGKAVSLDMRGYIVVDINTAPGSSGGLLLGRSGPIGVNSSDFVHERGYKSAFVTPIDRLGPLLSKPGKVL